MDRERPGAGAVARAAVLAGLLAGVIDIGVAALINRISPALILQAVASGLLGLAAYKVQWAIVLGLTLQIAMSVLIAAIYAGAAGRVTALAERPLAAGLGYGAIVFFVMNFIVVPLSAFAPRPAHVTLSWLAFNFGAMLLFGVLVAFTVNRSLAAWRASARMPAGGAPV
jgi:hypothetical protein